MTSDGTGKQVKAERQKLPTSSNMYQVNTASFGRQFVDSLYIYYMSLLYTFLGNFLVNVPQLHCTHTSNIKRLFEKVNKFVISLPSHAATVSRLKNR